MQVILLAAGMSTRLYPVSDKNTLEFSGKPLIEHQVAALKKAKLRDVVVIGGAHNSLKLKKILKSYKNVLVVEQKEIADGMAGGVLAGAKKVTHKNIMVMSTNDVFDFKLFDRAIIESKSGTDGVVVGAKVDEYFPGGYLITDKKNFIVDIIEKPNEDKVPSNWINLVLHIYNDFPAFIQLLQTTPGKSDGRYEKALNNYIQKKKAKIRMVKYLGYWQPIKFPWHVLKVMNHFLELQNFKKPSIDKSAKIASSALIEGNVVIAPNVRIMHNAHIKGPAYIGEGTLIGNNAFVRESMIGKRCVIGFASEVTRSYVDHDVWTHGTYMGDSIINENVSFGSGTVLANLRFDEENVKVNIKNKRHNTGSNKFGAIVGSGTRFGVNTSVNPGIIIGRDCFIGGGLLVDQDIADEKMVLSEQKLKIVSNHKKAATVTRNKR